MPLIQSTKPLYDILQMAVLFLIRVYEFLYQCANPAHLLYYLGTDMEWRSFCFSICIHIIYMCVYECMVVQCYLS